MHDDGPDVDSNVENDNSIEADLGAATLGQFLSIENEAKAEAANTELMSVLPNSLVWSTYMQKNGEMSDESARARTVKWMPRYVDQEPLYPC